MRRLLFRALLSALVCLIALSPVAAGSAGAPSLTCGVADIAKYGNLVLDISGTAFLAQGFDYGDIVSVDIGGTICDMPVCADYSDVSQGDMVCRVTTDEDAKDNRTILAVNIGDLASTLGLATQIAIDGDPGWRWIYADAFANGVTVTFSVKQKGGYLADPAAHRLSYTNNREDYPNLSDEQFANFRNIATTGMGANVLYRSSSPVNPQIGRNLQADAAANAAGIRTVMNLADSEDAMNAYDGYARTYYSRLNVIPLNLDMSFHAEPYRQGLIEGFRYLAGHDGPYLLHCTEGKDRTGYASALLECLMGAGAEEVVADYMLTFYNYFGVEPGTKQYETLWRNNIARTLSTAFGIDDITARGVDLAACAEAYLKDNGMSDGEIAALKDRLGTDIQ